MKKFVSEPPGCHLAIKKVREQYVVLEHSSGIRIRFAEPPSHEHEK